MTDNPHQVFSENQKRYQSEYDTFDRQYQFYSLIRIALFLISVGLASYLFYSREMIMGGVVGTIGILIFGLVVNHHKKIAFNRKQRDLLVLSNQEEIQRLDLELASFDKGDDFIDDNHNYTSDLDVFGSNSLFQLLNRTTIPTGRKKLAEWLKSPTSRAEIEKRQAAIVELRDKNEWRQNFHAFPRHQHDPKVEEKFEAFSEWMSASPVEGLSKKFVLGILLGIFNLTIVLLVIFLVINYKFLFLSMLLGFGLIRSLQEPTKEATDASEIGVKLLSSYQLLMKWLAREQWNSDLVKEQVSLIQTPKPAVQEIDKLRRLLDTLSSRNNFIYWIFNPLFAIDIHLVIRIENWKRNNSDHFELWIEAISEIEALSGIAGYAFANPDYAFPEIASEDFQLECKTLAHPLIKTSKRVGNDFNIDGEGRIGVITGSNMSGKSTFLRTVGINLLLAQIGAPVCASSFKFSPTQLFTSMRTSDNLEESVSSFYAELKRIERLLQLVANNQPIFFMLDEILKGTNTKDRHLGAQSLIKQLGNEKCTGLISTHDIGLGEINKSTNILNLHFSSEIVDHELIFDYTLKKGVCQSFNASELMSRIGIRLEK